MSTQGYRLVEYTVDRVFAIGGADAAQQQQQHAPAPRDLLAAAAPPPPTVQQGAWQLDSCNIPAVWSKHGTRGRGVRVAVIDTGVDPRHPCLPTVVAHDYAGSGPLLGATDQQGHGTHVCGLIAGATTGVAPEATVVSIKVFGPDGAAAQANIIRALKDVRDGAFGAVDIINMSLGSPQPCEEMRLLLMELTARGKIVVCAAGNQGAHDAAPGAPRFGTVAYPASFSNTLAVGSVNDKNARSAFSSTGPNIAVMAPGEAVLSTWLKGGLALLSGTSMAAPFLSGCLALLLSACKARGVPPPGTDAVLFLLAATSADMMATGFDLYTGNGRVCPDALISKWMEFSKRK